MTLMQETKGNHSGYRFIDHLVIEYECVVYKHGVSQTLRNLSNCLSTTHLHTF